MNIFHYLVIILSTFIFLQLGEKSIAAEDLTQALGSLDEKTLSEDALKTKKMIEEMSQKISDPAVRTELYTLTKFLMEKLNPKLSPEAQKARDMTKALLVSLEDPKKSLEEILKTQMNPLLAYLDSEFLKDEAFYMYKSLNDFLETHAENQILVERIIQVLSRCGESSRPLIKEVVENYAARVMREAMDKFYADPTNETYARSFIKVLQETPTLLETKPGLAVLLVSPKDLLEKGGNLALSQVPALLNGLTPEDGTAVLWIFTHPSLKAPAWIDFFLKLQERHRNLKSDIIIDSSKLGNLERPLTELLPNIHKDHFVKGMAKVREDLSKKGSTTKEGQKEYEAVIADYGPQTPFDINKYGPNPALMLFRLPPDQAGELLKNLLGTQMSVARTAYYSLLSFTNKDHRKALIYLYVTAPNLGGLQRETLLKNLPTTTKNRSKTSKNDVHSFMNAFNTLPEGDRQAVTEWIPSATPTPSISGSVPPPPPPPPAGSLVPPPPPPPAPLTKESLRVPSSPTLPSLPAGSLVPPPLPTPSSVILSPSPTIIPSPLSNNTSVVSSPTLTAVQIESPPSLHTPVPILDPTIVPTSFFKDEAKPDVEVTSLSSLIEKKNEPIQGVITEPSPLIASETEKTVIETPARALSEQNNSVLNKTTVVDKEKETKEEMLSPLLKITPPPVFKFRSE